jgi:hypothetical protein
MAIQRDGSDERVRRRDGIRTAVPQIAPAPAAPPLAPVINAITTHEREQKADSPRWTTIVASSLFTRPNLEVLDS